MIQLPIFNNTIAEKHFGMRKIWKQPLVHYNYEDIIKGGFYHPFNGMVFDDQAFNMQMAICALICLISLQSEIFSSAGYIKYVSQTDGSMDLLVKLNELK